MITISTMLLVLITFAVPCFAVDTYYPTPSHDQIKKWWQPEYGAKPDEELDIGDVHPVRLKSGEEAFVALVGFPRGRRARCDRGGILLVRPELEKARQIDPRRISINPSISEVIDLDTGRITGVVISGACTSTGETHGSNTLLYFDEWQPVVLHSRAFESSDDCGKALTERSCHDEEAKWFFRDIDGDGTKDLVELIVTSDGEERDQMTSKIKINAYLIKDKQLIAAPPGLIQCGTAEPAR